MKPLEPLDALDSTFEPVIRRYSFRITDGSSTMGSPVLSEEGRPSATLGVALGSAAAGASPVVRVTPPPPDPPWARDRLPARGRGYPASARTARVDAATAREESLTASVERATTPAMARLSAIEASLSSRRMSMMERIKMFDKG